MRSLYHSTRKLHGRGLGVTVAGWWRSPTGNARLSVWGLDRVASVLVAVSLRILRKRRQEGSEC